jgi:hypothetical protein
VAPDRVDLLDVVILLLGPPTVVVEPVAGTRVRLDPVVVTVLYTKVQVGPRGQTRTADDTKVVTGFNPVTDAAGRHRTVFQVCINGD